MNFEDVYTRHMDAVKKEEITVFTQDRIFTSKGDLAQYLEEGNLSSELVRQTAEHCLSVAEQIGFWTLLHISPRAEKKYKATFMGCLECMGCIQTLGEISDDQLMKK